MSFCNSACHVVTLGQQQEQNIQHHQQCTDAPVNSSKSRTTKNCTIVENGRVVVKPIETQSKEDS